MNLSVLEFSMSGTMRPRISVGKISKAKYQDMKQKSHSVSKSTDPRTAQTVRQIDAAFLGMMQRRAYSGIRVSDISKKAGVGRATFYAHYASKHELLRSQLRRVVVPMLIEHPEAPYLFDCTVFFEHIAHARFTYRSLMTGPSRLIAERIVRDCLEERVRSALARGAEFAEITAIPRFVAAALLTLVVWWVENDLRLSPARMQNAYQALVGGGLQAMRQAAPGP
jgi:AcrR family transcriptional regulator